MAGAVAQAFVVQLGGGDGAGRGWGRCLAVRVGPELSSLRSQLGNELAAASAAQGLRAMAVVAYLEVRQGVLSRQRRGLQRRPVALAASCSALLTALLAICGRQPLPPPISGRPRPRSGK